jgi:hypothetical protein
MPERRPFWKVSWLWRVRPPRCVNTALQAAPVALHGDPEAWWSRLIVQANLSAAPEALLDTWNRFGVAVDGAVRHAKQMAEDGRVREAGDAYRRALPGAERFGHPRPEARAGHGVLAVVSDAFADGLAPLPDISFHPKAGHYALRSRNGCPATACMNSLPVELGCKIVQ